MAKIQKLELDRRIDSESLIRLIPRKEYDALVAVEKAAKAFLKPFQDMDDDAGSNMNILEDALKNLVSVRGDHSTIP